MSDAPGPPLVEEGGHARLETSRRIRVLGVGMGPQHVTPEVAAALRSVSYVVAAAKSADDGLLAVRRAICEEYGVPLVAVADPPRSADDGYVRGVEEWHAARVAAYAAVLADRPGDVAFLVWGDPSLYDSTIRVVAALEALVGAEWDVLPGVSAPSLLAARHRIVLHEVGRPVHITTGRRLPSLVEACPEEPRDEVSRRERVAGTLDNLVVMLGSAADLADLALDDWSIWWGANLGAPGERLAAGRVGDLPLAMLRDEARCLDGWLMEVFLLRAPA